MFKKYFFRRTSINYSGVIFHDKSPLSLVPGEISWGVSCSGMNYSGTNVQGEKVRGLIALRGISRGNCPGGSYSSVIVWVAKIWEVIILGEFRRGQLCGGLLSMGNYSGVIVRRKKVRG